MSDTLYVGKKAKDLTISPGFEGYSKVVLEVDEEVTYTAGDDTGRTLTLSCPWGTQEMAQDILNDILGYQYQPYTADSACIDPAVELGDGITVNQVYGGVYVKNERFGHAFVADVSAPQDEETDHELGSYQSADQRQITRNNKQLKATLRIHASEIDARVTKESDDATNSFGWRLNSDSWTLYSGSSDNAVLYADKDGLSVTGTIKATDGIIGGFTIKDGYLCTNNQTFNGTNSYGIYIGPDGIQLGTGFKVDSAGNLNASSGTFSGNVYAGNIQYGGSYGTLNGGGITGGSITGGGYGQIAAGTITAGNTAFSGTLDQVWANYAEIQSIRTNWLTTNGLYAGHFYYQGRHVRWYYIDGIPVLSQGW